MTAAVRTRWVLVVTGDEDACGAIVDVIGLEPDLAAIGATTAERALRVMVGLRVQALVVDLALPGMSGLDLIERLRADAATRAVPIVVVTDLPADALPRRVAAEVHPVVATPFDPVELLAAIRGVLDRRGGGDRRGGADRRS